LAVLKQKDHRAIACRSGQLFSPTGMSAKSALSWQTVGTNMRVYALFRMVWLEVSPLISLVRFVKKVNGAET
jgi:hypothetical protein